MTKPLLVGSVYGTTPRNPTWYHLQREFLTGTTRMEFDFAVVLNNVPQTLFDPDVTVVASRDKNYGHLEGMNLLLEYFRSTDHQYYLILDSDCFPVCDDWTEKLLGLLHRFGKSVAAPVRFENFDRFAHPCALFMTVEGLQKLPPFGYQQTTDLLDREITENHFANLSFLPLLRSNVYSPHPVWAAIYNHLFYHHGAGSRIARSRSTVSGYFDHYIPPESHQPTEQELYAQLCANPSEFIGRLLGMHGPAETPGVLNGISAPRTKRPGILQALFGGHG